MFNPQNPRQFQAGISMVELVVTIVILAIALLGVSQAIQWGTRRNAETMIEVKAIGLELSSKHLKQAVNYASREGIKWVVLTNGMKWEIHRVSLEDKVQNEKIFTIDFTDLNPKHKEQQELLFLLCKRGVQKDLIGDYYEYKQSVNRHPIGALLL
ncbi:MAG: type I restriction enzyme HsdR N-terminal domain-containing protein, partial [Proteobacteria bacterium]|nr:type I restriction enzyme HsdR N-terminal domain-containing protein [Pseudomonadota bacterium]